jgi:hypothetical protein
MGHMRATCCEVMLFYLPAPATMERSSPWASSCPHLSLDRSDTQWPGSARIGHSLRPHSTSVCGSESSRWANMHHTSPRNGH